MIAEVLSLTWTSSDRLKTWCPCHLLSLIKRTCRYFHKNKEIEYSCHEFILQIQLVCYFLFPLPKCLTVVLKWLQYFTWRWYFICNHTVILQDKKKALRKWYWWSKNIARSLSSAYAVQDKFRHPKVKLYWDEQSPWHFYTP